ncbi:TetR/AcrR family transcriptional regulator [Rhodococcus sp. CH91]|uniref:TetR/AcrR family transcriptional regulator n=1 Tax=Rhodococcus sp. CH91 TaxID=2910256 RepID=UPI001F4AF267|nr:TetR/AcrR family transcriptional regulator [Rhodococcus sp. CH91]
MSDTRNGSGTRDTERTRRAILDAAAQMIHQHGTATAIGAVAEAAGVSKGGLLHHFRSRDELFVAVAEHSLNTLRERVFAAVDLSENRPGKLLRAYIRVLFDGEDDIRSHFEYPGMWNTLCVVPGVAELLRADAHFWRTAFAEDGLHPDRILLVQHAADGLVSNMLWDTGLTGETIRHARELLLNITERNTAFDS